MRRVPKPNYDYNVNELVTAYKNAVKEILRELGRTDITNFQRTNANATLRSINEILSGLNDQAAKWAKENIPKSARDAVVATIIELGVAETIRDAEKIAKFNSLNKEMIATTIADVHNDLLTMTNNVSKRVRSTVQRVVAQVRREKAAQGINGRRTTNRAIIERLERELGRQAQTGIIDAGGNRWKVEDYTDMVTRTKMLDTYREATTNEAVGRGALYGVISSHGATDSCGPYEGKIIRLTSAGDPQYPTYDELRASNKIFHPRCKHYFSVIKNPQDA